MKRLIPALLLLCISAVPSRAWNCSDPLAARVPVPAGTQGTFGDGDGQLFLGTGTEGVKGQLYECKVPTPTPAPKSGPVSQTQTQNQSQTQSQNASQNSTQNTSNQNVSSSGSTSKSTSNANSQSNSSNSNSNVNNVSPVLNSTNSSQGGTATSSSSGTVANNSNGNTSTYESNTTVDAAKIPVATALAVAPPATSPCVVGFGGGVQTMAIGGSISGGKIDKNCAILETARSFASMNARLAYCKTMLIDKYAKKAGITLDDCMKAPAPVAVAPQTPAPPPQPISVVIQQPQPIKVDTPTPAVVHSPTLTDLGSFQVTRSYSTNVCPTVQTVLGPRGVDILNRAVSLAGQGEVILIGNVYTTAVATNYLRKHGVNRVVIRAADEQNSSVGVQIWTTE